MKQQNRITCKNSKTFKLAGVILLLLIGANTIVSATPSDDRFKFVIGPRIGMMKIIILIRAKYRHQARLQVIIK